MSTPASSQPELPHPPEEKPPSKFNPPRHGTVAQWVSAVVALLAFGLALQNRSLTKAYHDEATQAKASDEHINNLIDSKLNPAVDKVNENIDAKLGPINEQLRELNRLIGQLQGKVGTVASEQNKINLRLDQQKSLANLMAPDRVLRTIRSEIQAAKASAERLPVSTLIDYKNAVQTLPASAFDYWRTVAEIINYQSFLNQMNDKAPDPAKVSHRCSGLTAGTGQGNLIQGGQIVKCILDLDTTHNLLENLVIRDSVVRYHGGPVEMRDVLFVNCYFDLDLSKSAPQKAPAHPEVLLALLDSNQQRVKLSTRPAGTVPN
jgi:hypothetical protein